MKALVLSLAAAMVACSGSSSKLSVSTKVATSPAAAVIAGGGASPALAIGTHVTLERARILVRKVTLEGASLGDGSGDGGAPPMARSSSTEAKPSDAGAEDGDEAEVHLGPLVVDLSGSALDGGVKILIDEPVPAGTYDELTFQIHPLTPGETVSDPGFAPGGHSILLDLTVDGAPATFTSDLTAVAEIGGPIKVAAGGKSNVTVTIDPSGWFTAPDGSFLDPRVDANRSQIEQNIRASIHGFQDDDRDGVADR